jgi:hypothetical protein
MQPWFNLTDWSDLIAFLGFCALAVLPLCFAIVSFFVWRLVRVITRIADRLDEFGVPGQVQSQRTGERGEGTTKGGRAP